VCVAVIRRIKLAVEQPPERRIGGTEHRLRVRSHDAPDHAHHALRALLRKSTQLAVLRQLRYEMRDESVHRRRYRPVLAERHFVLIEELVHTASDIQQRVYGVGSATVVRVCLAVYSAEMAHHQRELLRHLHVCAQSADTFFAAEHALRHPSIQVAMHLQVASLVHSEERRLAQGLGMLEFRVDEGGKLLRIQAVLRVRDIVGVPTPLRACVKHLQMLQERARHVHKTHTQC
jgi:hypothetical protein